MGVCATLSVTLVPHTHWDREWYLPFEGFRERLIPVMDELLDLLDRRYPHFHLDGQTALIDDYLAVRPEREPEIRRHAQAGRISVGPWLTLVDEFLVSGETIVRSLELGLERARELGGGDLVGYLPDQFGHIGQMPQILRAAGIDNAVVWRGVPAAIDRTVFRWEAPDGSEVLAEYLPFGYSLGGGLREAGDLGPALERLESWLAPFSARPRRLIMAGSDHLPVDPALPGDIAGLDAEIRPLADHLHSPTHGALPSWRGELRSAARAHLLPGVYSTRIHQKQERARIEALVERYAEPLAALVPGFEWPQRELDRIWRLLVLNGAHDSVCGCSVDEVAHAVDERHTEARSAAEELVGAALASLAAQVGEAGTLRFNPSPFERDGVPGLGWRVDEVATEPPEVAAELDFSIEDEPDKGDLYNFCPGDGVPPITEVRVQAVRREGEPFVRLDVKIDNRRSDHRLRLRIPLPERVEQAVAGSPFELVTRALVSEGGEVELPSPTWPARGVVLAGGVAVLAEGVIEYEVASGRELAVTLLRCVGTISRAGLATRPAPAGPDVPTPEAQMIGRTRLALAVLRDARATDLVPAWERFALPLRSVPASGGGRLPPSGTLLDVRGAALSSVRCRGDAVEARIWNPSATEAEASVGGATVRLGPARIETVRGHPGIT